MFVLPFDKVEDRQKVGEKAYLLSKLYRDKLPVPPGFVITGEAFSYFMRKNNLESRIIKALDGVNLNDYEKLVEVYDEIVSMFQNSVFPDNLKNEIIEGYESLLLGREAKKVGGAALDFIKAGRDQVFVAVRASYISNISCSFSGLAENSFNISGQKNLLDAIKTCWASLFSPNSLVYLKKNSIENALMGIIVQKMINPEKSGCVSMRKEDVIVESCWGLGHSISYGLVIPDRYILDKYSGTIKDKTTGKKFWIYRRDDVSGKTIKEVATHDKVEAETLDEAEIHKIFELYQRVSEQYATSIEWSIERGRIYLLQAKQLYENGGAYESDSFEGNAITGFSISRGLGKGPVRMITNTEDFKTVSDGDIIVTKVLSPELAPFLVKISGIISEYGSFSSNLSFVCREFGIPCVSEIDIASFTNQQFVNINGDKVYIVEPEPAVGDMPTDLEKRFEKVTATEVFASLDLTDGHFGSKDIGIVRPEQLFSGIDPFYLAKTNPEETINRLGVLEHVAKESYPKIVWYRAYDMPSDNERNPVIGYRGVRRVPDSPEMFKCEIEAIKRLYSRGLTNVGLLLPFVSCVEELKPIKNLIPFSFKLGIEISTPSAALEIEGFCKEGVNFIVINLSELAKLTIGVDPDNPKVSSLYSEKRPSLMKLVQEVVDTARRYSVNVCVYVRNYDPDVIERLVRMGVHAISLEPSYIDIGKELVSRIEKRLILENLRYSL